MFHPSVRARPAPLSVCKEQGDDMALRGQETLGVRRVLPFPRRYRQRGLRRLGVGRDPRLQTRARRGCVFPMDRLADNAAYIL